MFHAHDAIKESLPATASFCGAKSHSLLLLAPHEVLTPRICAGMRNSVSGEGDPFLNGSLFIDNIQTLGQSSYLFNCRERRGEDNISA
jgi:hypothetical protein